MIVSRRLRREAKRLLRLCMVEGRLDDGRAREVAAGLAESRNRNRLAVLGAFERLVRREETRRTATIASAAPLSGEQREGILAGLAGTYGPGLKPVFVEDPALIGGMRVQVGSDVYDGSVRTRYRDMEAGLRSGPDTANNL